jgi:CheY-like chemotaxis protein
MIFIVDDDPIQNMLVSHLLKAVSPTAEYREFVNGSEVLDAISSGTVPHIILLDINMPIMNGWEFLEAYNNQKNQAAVYIVSSSSDEYDLDRAKEFECIKGYFNKPINEDSIKMILSESSN